MASPASLRDSRRARWTGLARRGEAAPGFSLAAAMDGLTGFAVLAFASWTLLYDIGAMAHLGTSLLLALWVAALVATVAGLVRFSRASGVASAVPIPSARWLSVATPWRRPLGIASVVLGVAAGLAVGLHTAGLPWAFTWALAGPAVAATMTSLLPPAPAAPPAAGRPAARPPSAAAPAGPAVDWRSLVALAHARAAALLC